MSKITELQKKIKELESSAKNDIDCILLSIGVFSVDYTNPNRFADTIKLYDRAYLLTGSFRFLNQAEDFLKQEEILSVECRKKLRAIYNDKLIDYHTISDSKAIWLWYTNDKFAIESTITQ